MTREKTDEQQVFDVDKIRELIELMEQHDLSEVDLRNSERRVRLRRGATQIPPVVGYPPPAPISAPSSATSSQPEPEPAKQPSLDEANVTYIKSPTIGTFYSKPKPDAEDFVKVGDKVEPDTVVCLVEAMKMYNEIHAGVSGKIVERLVNNEDPVDVNKPLFKVATA